MRGAMAILTQMKLLFEIDNKIDMYVYVQRLYVLNLTAVICMCIHYICLRFFINQLIQLNFLLICKLFSFGEK